MDETIESPIKRTLSAAELAARRANAQKSTGPRNTERSRFNRLTHGLRASLPVIPGESQEAYDERLAEWMEDYAPKTGAVRFLVQRAVELSFKLERGDVVEEALSDEALLEAQYGTDRSPEVIAKLAATLPDDPHAIVPQLRASSGGCAWLLSRWEVLLSQLLKYRRLNWTERSWAVLYLGKFPADGLRNDPLVIRWHKVLLGSYYRPQDDLVLAAAGALGTTCPVDMHPTEFEYRAKELAKLIPGAEESYSTLQSYIEEVIAELKKRRKFLRKLEQEKRTVALRRARIDLGEDGKQLLRYQTSHRGSLETTLRRIDALQNPRQPRPPGRPKKTRPEVVTAEPTAAMTAPAGPEDSGAGVVESGSATGASGLDSVESGSGFESSLFEVGNQTAEGQGAVASQDRTNDSEPMATEATQSASDASIENRPATTNEPESLEVSKNSAGTTTEPETDALENSAATTNEPETDALENSAATTNEAKSDDEVLNQIQVYYRSRGFHVPSRETIEAMGLEIRDWVQAVIDANPPHRFPSAAAVPRADGPGMGAVGERGGGFAGEMSRAPPSAGP